MKKIFIILLLSFNFSLLTWSSSIFIPMDDSQKNHLKAYGITYWILKQGGTAQWLLNYKGGSFMFPYNKEYEKECVVRGVTFQVIADVQANAILAEIESPDANMDAVKLEKAPKVAVYSPKTKQPWDDAVTLVLTYAEIPYDLVYDDDVMANKLVTYDWLHLHHEDFTGQYGRFWAQYKSAAWYQDQVRESENDAHKLGFTKVSQLKLAVAKKIKDFVTGGGFLFAMCSATDSYDIALAAEGVDICESQFDGDPADPDMNKKIDYSKGFAFRNYTLNSNPSFYEFANIDTYWTRVPNYGVTESNDLFTLFEFSAKWDPVPTMLCQNHEKIIKGFWGQTVAFDKTYVRPDVLIMGEAKQLNEVRYCHGDFGKGFWTYYGGHDPEDYQHKVGDPPTDLALHPNSPGYRLILNNILFPAAKKKKQKT
ncbi:MAG: asparagine synthetase B [Bacteroidia bacterium]